MSEEQAIQAVPDVKHGRPPIDDKDWPTVFEARIAAPLRQDTELTSGAVRLMPSTNERGRLQGLVGAFGKFQRTGRELGLTAADCPINQHDKCIRS